MHMNSATSLAAGVKVVMGSTQGAATQAAWRFLNNQHVTLEALVQPLREAGRMAAAESDGDYLLLVHDWSRIYYPHESKTDRRNLSHEKDVGYDLTTALLVDAQNGSPLAPMQMHLRTADTVHSTAQTPPGVEEEHLTQLAPMMREAENWNLEKPVVHIIDREADSLGHMRQWGLENRLFLVRCDDRRVKYEGREILISEIVAELSDQEKFECTREVTVRGEQARQMVAEVEVVLYRPHKTRIDGKQKEIAGAPLPLRLVVVRAVDKTGAVLSEWTLLSNVPVKKINTATIALWYYWRWLIETYFKLIKSAGQQMEAWQQETGIAIMRRLLVASMACVVVWKLQRADTPEAAETRKLLIALSRRQMKHNVEHTAPALLAGYFVLLSMADLLEHIDYDLEKLNALLAQTLPFKNSS